MRTWIYTLGPTKEMLDKILASTRPEEKRFGVRTNEEGGIIIEVQLSGWSATGALHFIGIKLDRETFAPDGYITGVYDPFAREQGHARELPVQELRTLAEIFPTLF